MCFWPGFSVVLPGLEPTPLHATRVLCEPGAQATLVADPQIALGNLLARTTTALLTEAPTQ